MRKRVSLKRSDGFTIVELMIATAVLATMLVMVTVLMINVGNLYYKGINQARVQGSVRNVVDEVAQQLQLSNSFAPAPPDVGLPNQQAYCIGTVRFTFITNVQIGHPNPHILWRDNNPSPGSCSMVNLMDANLETTDQANHGTELIPPNSTLTAFCIGTLAGATCTPDTVSPYTVSVGVAYGDHDLLNLNGINSVCRGDKGNQFCATANLSTVATQRLTGN